MSTMTMFSGAVKPTPVRSTPIGQRTLPAIDGSGLTLDEWFRLGEARNGARAAFAADNPEATPGEIDDAGDLAAKRCLRDVLKDRPAAPPLGEKRYHDGTVSVACCSPGERVPCAACIPPTDEPDDQDEAEGDDWGWRFAVADDCCPQWIENEPGLTLETVLERMLERVARNPGYADTDLVVWHQGCVHAIVSTTDDGVPYAMKCTDHPEADWSIKVSVITLPGTPTADLPSGNDVEHDPAWREWLDGVDATAPERVEDATLSLPELIEQEAGRLRRMETDAGDLMARTLAQLAKTVRFVQARTPGDFEARLEVLEQDDREPEPEPELTASGRWA